MINTLELRYNFFYEKPYNLIFNNSNICFFMQ